MTIRVRRKGAVHVANVESDKEPGKEYEIARLPDGQLACACMAYVFNKETPKTCKHIRAMTAPPGMGTGAIALSPDTAMVMHQGETFTFKRAISFGKVPA